MKYCHTATKHADEFVSCLCTVSAVGTMLWATENAGHTIHARREQEAPLMRRAQRVRRA